MSQWNPYTTYSTGNVISYQSIEYTSLQNSNYNHNPPLSALWWQPSGHSANVTSVTGGLGISTTGTTSVVVAANLTAGSGISLSGTTGTETITNSGVLDVSGGPASGIIIGGNAAHQR